MIPQTTHLGGGRSGARWAADKALDPDPDIQGGGIRALFALLDAQLLQSEDEGFVREITAYLASGRVTKYANDVEFELGQEGADDDG